MPEFGKCWNEACLLYGQAQEVDKDKPTCQECGQRLMDYMVEPLVRSEDK